MRRGAWLLLFLLPVGWATEVAAASARSWALASADRFAQGTLEGAALDGEGRITLAPALEPLWGPEGGIVWDVESDGAGGAFIALSSPTRVLHVGPGREPEFWHATGDETLVAAILPDGEGGVYMGLSVDGRLLHATGPGVAREVADSEARFIWALAADADGAIWMGTGLPGRLLRIDSDGESHVVFESGDDPVRCITALDEGGVVFGTGGRGRVVRVGKDGRPFVLFDADESEIVAVETGEDGVVYALAAQGAKQIAAARSAAAATPDATVRVTANAPDGNGEDRTEEDDPADERPKRKPKATRFKTAPGGALYRIGPDGDFRRLWQAKDEVPFGLARGGDGRLMVATGDSGRIYAVDDAGRASTVLQIASDQVSALSLAEDGAILVGGTTDARVARIRGGVRTVGSYVTPVHDAGTLADWGRVRWEADRPDGAVVRALVRGGNSAEPDQTWTDWTPLGAGSAAEGETALPATRWFQARLDLTASRTGGSPAIRRFEAFYRTHNRQPAITAMTVEPAGVVWVQAAASSSRPVGPLVTDDPVARKTAAGLRPAVGVRPVRKLYESGARTIGWTAADPDGDRLTYRIAIRREGAEAWIPLAEGLEGRFFGWDARSLADGLYRVRVVADDARDNPRGRELEDVRTSEAFRIDHTRPSLGSPKMRRRNGMVEVEFVARDPGGIIAIAEVALDAKGWQPIDPVDGVADEAEESYRFAIDFPEGPGAGRPRSVRVRVTDSAGNLGGDAWTLDGGS